MPMGYCMECHKLVFIRPVARLFDSRQCDWRPHEHGRITHGECPRHLESPEVGKRWHCELCEKDVSETDLVVARCPGTKRTIR